MNSYFRPPPLFKDRREAGRELAQSLLTRRGEEALLVLALPRGGVVVGKEIALELGAPLEIFISKKLSAPGNPELAFGALTENGALFLHSEVITQYEISDRYIQREIGAKKEEIVRSQQLYRRGRKRPSFRGGRIIVVDDGIATGATLFAALQALRQEGAQQVTSAIPVAPQEAAEHVRSRSDEAIILYPIRAFISVGSHYLHFDPVSDEEIFSILEETNSNGRKKAA